MSRHNGPRAGSYPRQLLEAVGAAPDGSLPYAQAMQVMPSAYRSSKRFESLALKALEQRWAMVASEGSMICLLPAGSKFLQQCRADALPPAARYVGQLAQPRTPVFRPMSMASFARLMGPGPQRPGMDDLRDCPSLMGGQRMTPGAVK